MTQCAQSDEQERSCLKTRCSIDAPATGSAGRYRPRYRSRQTGAPPLGRFARKRRAEVAEGYTVQAKSRAKARIGRRGPSLAGGREGAMRGEIGQRRRRITGNDPRFAAIVEASGAAIVSVDADRIVETWNVAAEGLFGIPAAQAVGAPFDLLAALPLSELLPTTFDAEW